MIVSGGEASLPLGKHHRPLRMEIQVGGFQNHRIVLNSTVSYSSSLAKYTSDSYGG